MSSTIQEALRELKTSQKLKEECEKVKRKRLRMYEAYSDDLDIEDDFDEEEYMNDALSYAQQIKADFEAGKLTEEDAEQIWNDYNFSNNPPVDDAEQEIYDVLEDILFDDYGAPGEYDRLADKFADELENSDDDYIEEIADEFDFDNNGPVDDAEEKIYNAISRRRNEALKKKAKICPDCGKEVCECDKKDLQEAKRKKGKFRTTFPAGNPAKNIALFNHDMGHDVTAGGVEAGGGEGCCENLNEDVESSMPAQPLDRQQLIDAIDAVKPGTYVNAGYLREIPVNAAYRGGRGSEGQPMVRVFKATEVYGRCGIDYENTQAVKDIRAQGIERSGNKYQVDSVLGNKILKATGTGNDLLQIFPRSKSDVRVRYFISFDDEDLRPTNKEEAARYCSSLNNTTTVWKDDAPMRLNLNKIYYFKNLGNSIIR